jgi:hypothetical protein
MKRSKVMKNRVKFIIMLAAAAVLSAVPAFSSSGPFGAFGPADNTDKTEGIKTNHTTTVSGTGPYGALAVIEAVPGELSKHAATPGGSGPYGAFASFGMIPGSGSATVDKMDDCILVAKNCIPER